MKKVLMGLGVAALCLGAIGQASATELVTNGGFETGDFTGWTMVDGSGESFVDTSSPHSGAFNADLGAVGADGTLTQNLATVAGQNYTISFWLQNDGGTPQDFTALFNGDVLLSQTNAPASTYSLFSFTDTATSANTVLEFDTRNDPGFMQLDDISVTGAKGAVPEPGTVATVVMGAFMVGGLMLRRRVFTKSL